MWTEIDDFIQPNKEYLTCTMVNNKPLCRGFRLFFDGFWFGDFALLNDAPTHYWSN